MTHITRRLASATFLLLAGPAAALDLALPAGARLMGETVTDPGSYAVPTGPWTEAGVPVRVVEGRVLRQAWRIDSGDLTTLQILAPVRDGIEAQGYDVVFDCRTARCGGFDFRFGTEVIPAPEMYVDLTAFRFLAARGPGGDWLTLLASRSAAAGYLQVIRAGTADATPAPGTVPTPAPMDASGVAAQLEANGHVVLPDLEFDSGSDALDGTVASLEALTQYLLQAPTRRIVFVGHTDAVGSLEANRALSTRRAGAAMAYLRRRGVAPEQVSAEGVGYLAPLGSNLTAAGQEANRRVEAVLLP